MSIHRRNKAFTLMEVMIAAFLTVVITGLVFYMYRSSVDMFDSAERELRWLASFRSASDSMERELGSIVRKCGYLPADPENYTDSEPPKLNTIDGRIWDRSGDPPTYDSAGLFGIRFHSNYIGFYTSLDGQHIERVEYFYNRPESRFTWSNDEDEDEFPDAADAAAYDPLGLWKDDKGSFVVCRIADSGLYYPGTEPDKPNYDDTAEWKLPPESDVPHVASNPYDDSTNSAAEGAYHDRYTDWVAMADDRGDIGDVLADEIDNFRLRYIYITQKADGSGEVDPVLKYASRWPYDDDDDPFNGDLTGMYREPNVGLSYLALPLAVEMEFTFRRGSVSKTMTKQIFLYGSQWNRWMNDPLTYPGTP